MPETKTPEPLTPDAALSRLRQYGERTSTWSTATYNDGTERALADIARTLGAEVERLRAELAARPSRAEVLREAARAAGEFAEAGADADAVEQALDRMADEAEAGVE
ncbi:hypothetical protein [Streptomyces sp. NPDC060243]|uniref:hypothetical protein n=1 Tax=Streptomyces sp. NPDC060243 TaxID=3347081 RepID=UPI003663F35E